MVKTNKATILVRVDTGRYLGKDAEGFSPTLKLAVIIDVTPAG
jgi:hypothetical protein